MKRIFTSFLIILITLLCSCSKKSKQSADYSSYNSDSDDTDSEEEETNYPDGRYCARVYYYYSETGTSSTYTLAIDVEDGDLERIHWPNGGWLDHSHFSSADISDGTARFHSYEGVDYRVTIIGKDDECSLSNYAVDEDQVIEDAEEAREERNQELQEEQEEEEKKRQQEEMDEERNRRQQAEEEEKPNN